MSQGINNDMTASKPRHIVKNLRWWILVLFLLGVTVNYITRNSLGILAPELKSNLGITTEQYSWIVGAFQLAYTLFQPLCGWLIDVIGLKLGFMICGTVGAGLSDACGGGKLGTSGAVALLYGRCGSRGNPSKRQNHR